MPYFFENKKTLLQNLSSAAVVIGALRVKIRKGWTNPYKTIAKFILHSIVASLPLSIFWFYVMWNIKSLALYWDFSSNISVILKFDFQFL